MGGGGAGLSRGLEALKTFKKRVDAALANFEGSAGSSSQLAEHALSRASFSGLNATFHEASDLHAQYERVHERLTYLSKSLGLHIESLGIAVHGADIGFDNLEEEQRRRFWEIQAQIDQEHQENQREHDRAGVPDHKRSDNKKVGASFR